MQVDCICKTLGAKTGTLQVFKNLLSFNTNKFIAFYNHSILKPAVDHLSKYLAMRLTLDLETELPEADRLLNFCIYIAPHSLQFLVLNGNQTLQQVSEKFWKVSFNNVSCYNEWRVHSTIEKRYYASYIFLSLQTNKPMEMYYSWKKS